MINFFTVFQGVFSSLLRCALYPLRLLYSSLTIILRQVIDRLDSSGMNFKVLETLPEGKRDQFYRIDDYQGPEEQSDTSAACQDKFLSLPLIAECKVTGLCDLLSEPHVIPSPVERCSMRKIIAVGSSTEPMSEVEFRVICNGSLKKESDYLKWCESIWNTKKENGGDVFNSKAKKGVIFFVFQERLVRGKWTTEKIIVSKSGTMGELSTITADDTPDIVICGSKPTNCGQKGSSVHNKVALLAILYQRTAFKDQFGGSLERAANMTRDSNEFMESIRQIKTFLATELITKLWTDSRTFKGENVRPEDLEMLQIELPKIHFALTIFVAGNRIEVTKWNSQPLGYSSETLDWAFFQGHYDELRIADGINRATDSINAAFLNAFRLFCEIDIDQYLSNVAQCAEDNFLAYIIDNPLEKDRRYTAFSMFPKCSSNVLENAIVPPCRACAAHFFNDIGRHLFGENKFCTGTVTTMYDGVHLSI